MIAATTLFFCHQGNIEVELVVDGFVAQVIEKRAGAEAHIVLRAVNGDFARGGYFAVAFGQIGREFDLLRRLFDRQVADDLVVAFCVLRNGAGNDEFSRRVFGNTEKVVAFQVTDQFAGVFAFQIRAGDGVHIDFKGTAAQLVVVEKQVAIFDFYRAGMLAGHFVAIPYNVTGRNIHIVGVEVGGRHGQNSQKREEE